MAIGDTHGWWSTSSRPLYVGTEDADIETNSAKHDAQNMTRWNDGSSAQTASRSFDVMIDVIIVIGIRMQNHKCNAVENAVPIFSVSHLVRIIRIHITVVITKYFCCFLPVIDN